MAFEFVSVTDHGLDRTAELLTRGFADYFVRIPFTSGTLLQLVRGDSVDLTASRVLMQDGQPGGAALVARRGWTSRIAGMALVPESRRRGGGRELMKRLITDAKTRGERTMVLEVIEQNAPALALYEAFGFQRARRLVGFSCAATTEKFDANGLEEIDPRAAAVAACTHFPADIPWQLSGETLAQITPPARGYRLGAAWLVVNNVDATPVSIRALAYERSEIGVRDAAKLLRAVMAANPGKEWRMSAIWPEELSDPFLAASFTRTSLTQWQMRRSLE